MTLIEHPKVMRLCTRYGLPRPTLMRFTMKLLAHLYDTRDGDWMDKAISTLAKVAPVCMTNYSVLRSTKKGTAT